MIFISSSHFARRFGGLDHSGSNDIGVGFRDAVFFQFARNDLFDLIFQTERGEGHVLGGDGGVDFIAVGGEEAGEFVVKGVALVAIVGEEAEVVFTCQRGES